MVKMKKGILLLLFILVFLTGCGLQNLPGYKGPKQDKPVPRGIGLSFADGFPPSELVEDKDFSVRVNVINYGAREASGNIELSDGVGNAYEGVGDDVSGQFRLEGNEGDAGAGYDEMYVSFGPFRYKNLEEGQSATFIANAIFDYDYESIASLCINGFTSAGKKSKKCLDKETITGRALCPSSRICDAMTAPVAVTEIKKNSFVAEEGGEQTIQLDVKISNVGNGYIKDGEVNGIEVSSGDFRFDCDKDRVVFLYNRDTDVREKKIKCISSEGKVDGEFIRTPLIVKMKYAYVISNYYGTVQINKIED